MDHIDKSIAKDMERYKMEREEEWREWSQKLPFIPFEAGWLVKPIPPFAGAVARFLVKLPDGREKSVYFDAYARLGYMPEPYWEVYPVLGDTGRCLMNEVDELLRLINEPNDEPNAANGEASPK